MPLPLWELTVKVQDTFVLGFVSTFTCADALAFVAYAVLDPLAGEVESDSRDQTCVPPTQTELMTVLPIRMSVMLVPPTAIGIFKS